MNWVSDLWAGQIVNLHGDKNGTSSRSRAIDTITIIYTCKRRGCTRECAYTKYDTRQYLTPISTFRVVDVGTRHKPCSRHNRAGSVSTGHQARAKIWRLHNRLACKHQWVWGGMHGGKHFCGLILAGLETEGGELQDKRYPVLKDAQLLTDKPVE